VRSIRARVARRERRRRQRPQNDAMPRHACAHSNAKRDSISCGTHESKQSTHVAQAHPGERSAEELATERLSLPPHLLLCPALCAQPCSRLSTREERAPHCHRRRGSHAQLSDPSTGRDRGFRTRAAATEGRCLARAARPAAAAAAAREAAPPRSPQHAAPSPSPPSSLRASPPHASRPPPPPPPPTPLSNTPTATYSPRSSALCLCRASSSQAGGTQKEGDRLAAAAARPPARPPDKAARKQKQRRK